MESITKTDLSKKKRRKKQPREATKPKVQPCILDGSSNWLQLQKTLNLEKQKEKVEETPTKSFCLRRATIKKHAPRVASKSQSKQDVKEDPKFKFNFNTRGDKPQDHRSDIAKKRKLNNGLPMSLSDREDDESVELTKCVAMDCEMVGTGPNGEDSMLARVSIVNARGDCLYDTFVKPKETVTDYRTRVSGVRPADLKNAKKDLFEVQKDVLSIIEGRRIVGHALKHDFEVLFISPPRYLIRDTSLYKPFREVSNGNTPSLKKLSAVLLGVDIQCGEHSSVEDAQAAMLLYLRHKRDWEKEVKFRHRKKFPKPVQT